MHFPVGSHTLYVPQLESEDSDDSSRSSCKYEAYSASDFYISDMIFSAPPTTESNSEFDDRKDTLLLPDYKNEESNLLCDLTEEYMVLPFLEDTLDTGHDHPGKQSEETPEYPDNSSLYMAIHQLRSYNEDPYIHTYPDQEYEYFDPQMYIRSLPEQQDMALSFLPTPVPNEKQNTKKITLVLDLDGNYIVLQKFVE